MLTSSSLRAQSPRDRLLPKTNTKIGDREAYATSDLVMRHPTKPDLWKIVGRMDEQIILSNGEKVRHPLVLCLMCVTMLISVLDKPHPARFA